jgi:energy-converting hydrogenase Eha subunit F
MTPRRIWYVLICVASLVFALFLLNSCKPNEVEPKPLVPSEQVAPKKTGTPYQMKQQCINQPDIVYCQKRCDDTGLINKPSWCRNANR